MIRLDLKNEPAWLDLGHGVRLHLQPLTTALMVASRNDPVVAVLDEHTTDEASALVFAKALARNVNRHSKLTPNRRLKLTPRASHFGLLVFSFELHVCGYG